MEDSRRIEGLLRDEVALWSILFDQSRDGIVVLKQDGSVYQVNKQYADMLGYSLEEIKKLHVWDWDCQFDRNTLLEMIRTVDSSGDHFETRHRCKDGKIIDVELSTNGTIYKGEKLIFCICRNITERKQFQEQLNLHKIIVENSNTILFRWRVEPGWPTELVSENVQQFGYKADDLRSGAVAYATLIHPDDLERVAAEVKHHDETGAESFEQEYRIVCADGRVRWIYDRTVVERGDDGLAHHYQGIVMDITERKEAEERIRVLATTDGLTGILNRKEFTRLLESEIDRVNRYATQLSLIMYDLDHFKQINDNHGHDTGDKVLQTVVKLVCSNIRSVDIAARWGGEEFMVLLPQSSLEAARKIAEKLRLTVSRHDFGKTGSVTASFGVVEFVPGEDSNSLLKRVDKALYKAKNNGRNRVESIPFEAD
ncbi:MAG: diguanylate cyclase [Gammaproteobacteria bacterium]